MKPLSEAKLTFFSRLLSRKHRHREGLFLAEGWKLTSEALASGWELSAIVVRNDAVEQAAGITNGYEHTYVTDARTFSRLSDQEHPEGILAVVKIPSQPSSMAWEGGLVLDAIQDPGNAGTMIRLADWFGMAHVYCMDGTVDLYSPKAVRASMGGIFRVKVIHCTIPQLLESGIPIFLADMHGSSITGMHFPDPAMVVLGNESQGISAAWPASLPRITIPRLGGAESLNAAMAAAMICYQWKLGY